MTLTETVAALETAERRYRLLVEHNALLIAHINQLHKVIASLVTEASDMARRYERKHEKEAWAENCDECAAVVLEGGDDAAHCTECPDGECMARVEQAIETAKAQLSWSRGGPLKWTGKDV